MAISVPHALTLEPGTKLTFGNEDVFTLISVEKQGQDAFLRLIRDDGLQSHATGRDLTVATVLEEPPYPVGVVTGEILSDSDTAENLAVEGIDTTSESDTAERNPYDVLKASVKSKPGRKKAAKG